jgi:hypothetical protein
VADLALSDAPHEILQGNETIREARDGPIRAVGSIEKEARSAVVK